MLGHATAAPIDFEDNRESGTEGAGFSALEAFKYNGTQQVSIKAASFVPPNAPPDFWMDKDKQVARPTPPGRTYEFMYCDKKYNQKAHMCGGSCNYVSGRVDNGEITLFTPNTHCVVAPCDLQFQICKTKSHLLFDKMQCHEANIGKGEHLPNGKCVVTGNGLTGLRVGH